MEISKNHAIAASVVSLLVWNPMKLDGFGLEQSKDHEFSRTRMLWLWDIKDPLWQNKYTSLKGHYEFAFGQTMPSDPVVSLGISPVLEWHANSQWLPFIETGLGLTWFSKTTHFEREISTPFQFSQILGVGYRYKDIQLGLRYQHHSNGDVVRPNNGYNFYGLTAKFWY